MSYQTGKMGATEGAALVFIAILPRLTLNSFTIALAKHAQISWLYILINGVDVLLIAALFVYLYSKVPGDIYSMAVTLLGKPLSWVMMLLLILVFGGNAVLLIREYAENTLITALPDMDLQLSVLIYALSALVTTYLGVSGITRCSVLFMPLMIVTFLGVSILLYPFYIPYQLLPWQGNGLTDVFFDGILGAGYNVGFFALMVFATSYQNTATLRQAFSRGLTTGVLLKTYFMVIFLLVFGVEVGSEKTMPFFEMARLIYLGRFFQHIEAMFILSWVILGALAIAIHFFVVSYLLGRLLNLPVIRPIMPCLAMIMSSLAMIPDNLNRAVQLDKQLIVFNDAAIYGIPLLLLIGFWLKQRKGKAWTGEA